MAKKQQKIDAEKVVLEMSRDQAIVVERACELYARLHIGQFEMMPDIMMLGYENINEYCCKRDDAKDALKLAACLLFGRNMYGQPDCNKGVEHERAWGVYTVLRHARCWHDNPEGNPMSVCYDEPYNNLPEPLAKCKIIEGSDGNG